ncbi:hypothetical protein BB14905_14420 [Bacillus sp. B14905]|nr:hypothetical protein BB14905_14420 [Bacillus sp. B14905]
MSNFYGAVQLLDGFCLQSVRHFGVFFYILDNFPQLNLITIASTNLLLSWNKDFNQLYYFCTSVVREHFLRIVIPQSCPFHEERRFPNFRKRLIVEDNKHMSSLTNLPLVEEDSFYPLISPIVF